ncbi:MAG: FGGY-family carbohydrate kinase [Acidobacteriota bacterium]
MRAKGYLGLDLGGTGAKAGVFDPDGRLLGFGRSAFSPRVTASGAEVPIEQVYEAGRKAARAAIREAGAPVSALAFSSQGETFVSLDEQDRPLHDAILWYDSRAVEEAEDMRSELRASGFRTLAAAISPIFTAPKIVWLRKRHPDVMSRARRHLLLPDYFSYRLTGRAAIDPSTAGSTGLYEEEQGAYNPSALCAAGISIDQVAEVYPSGTVVAHVRPEIGKSWGLTDGTLLVSGTNDQYAGAVGAGNVRPGLLTETTGTCLALVTLADNRPGELPPGLFAGRFPIPNLYFILAYSKTAGLLIDWFRNQFCPTESLAELDQLAETVPLGSRGLTVLPHFDGVVSPVPNPKVRGGILNLTLEHTKADIYRALLESIAFALRENLDLMRGNGFRIDRVRSIGGGAKSDFWLQLKADTTGLPVEKPVTTEAAVLGAAMLAALGLGDFSSLSDCADRFYRAEKVFAPDPQKHELSREPYDRYRCFHRNLYPQ